MIADSCFASRNGTDFEKLLVVVFGIRFLLCPMKRNCQNFTNFGVLSGVDVRGISEFSEIPLLKRNNGKIP